MAVELPKAYEPGKYEDDISRRWEKSNFYNPDECLKKGVTSEKNDYFSIVLPPPNVTGTLHMGHAAMLAIEDIMVRYHRMKGDRTLWVPGTDHAAVATESKVESILIKEKGYKKPKQELGREKFLETVRKFAQDSHDTIVNQCKKMGASLDWSREAYTLDEQRNKAVRAVFKKMYDDGLIYRGYRVVNWSVKGQSTCSDDELVYIERPTKLYYFKYSKDFPITIATTRPETKLGDTAVAVHPNDDRYKKYIGQTFDIQVGGERMQRIKIISDEGVDPAFGTGALGVTPAHSVVDFEMYSKQKAASNDIGLVQVINEDGKMSAAAGRDYEGLGVLEAREKFVAYLTKNGLLEKEEDTVQNVGTSDRFGDVVEPLPKVQWFVDVNKKFELLVSKISGIKDGQEVTLKQLMQQVVNNKQIKIIPDRFEKTYFHWIDNLRDWNISRQIWFGHQVPVWYKGSETYVGVEAPTGEGWVQDSDTLDTWFSSGLWTFSTLGWPDFAKATSGKPNDLANYHPTSVLETGYDILFFWIARMILMTTYTLGDIPFKTIYLHGLVRDEQGRKMSKSIGNIINPLDMIDKYGTDATRLSLVLGNTPGNDLKLSEEKIAGFRNFANKLWNISRFMLLTIEKPTLEVEKPTAKTLADQWIIGRLSAIVTTTTEHLENYNLSYAGELLRDFTWGELADWYLEIAKVEGGKSEILNYILNTILKLWHPFMPFVTETIWSEIYGKEALLLIEKWPSVNKDEESGEEFGLVREIISAVRAWRSDNKIEPKTLLKASINAGENKLLVEANIEVIKKLSRLEELKIEKAEKKAGQIGFLAAGMEMLVAVEGTFDAEKEKVRITGEIEQTQKYVTGLESKLTNQDFVGRAPAAVVEKEKKKLEEAKNKIEKLQTQLQSLSSKFTSL